MIKYYGYVIIESEEDFKKNFHLGDGVNWERTGHFLTGIHSGDIGKRNGGTGLHTGGV